MRKVLRFLRVAWIAIAVGMVAGAIIGFGVFAIGFHSTTLQAVVQVTLAKLRAGAGLLQALGGIGATAAAFLAWKTSRAGLAIAQTSTSAAIENAVAAAASARTQEKLLDLEDFKLRKDLTITGWLSSDVGVDDHGDPCLRLFFDGDVDASGFRVNSTMQCVTHNKDVGVDYVTNAAQGEIDQPFCPLLRGTPFDFPLRAPLESARSKICAEREHYHYRVERYLCKVTVRIRLRSDLPFRPAGTFGAELAWNQNGWRVRYYHSDSRNDLLALTQFIEFDAPTSLSGSLLAGWLPSGFLSDLPPVPVDAHEAPSSRPAPPQ